ALGAQLCNLDVGGVYDVILRTIMVVGGDEFYQMVAGQIDGVEAQIGAKVRGGLLESLGGPVVFYVMPQGVDGMMTGGFVMVADLKDAALFEKTMKELAAFGLKMSEGMFQDSVVEKEGLKVHSWTIAPLAMAGVLPTWTIAEGKLVFASNSPMCNIAIKQVTAADKGKTSIRSTAAYKKIAEKLPKNLTGLRYSDTAASMRQALALIQQFWPMASGILGNQLGMPMPLKIPEAEGVISKMTPMVGYSWIDETGIHSRSQGPVLIEGTAAIGGGVLGAAFFMMGVRSSQEIMMKSPMDTATKVEIHQLDTAIEMYKLDTGSYPDPEKGLKALFQSEGVKGWKGPYIEGAKIHHDRWGNEYIYRISEKSGKPYILSQGPDGIEGSEDDISNR
ncbi:MAG: type II secretion system protein GspG, partial [Phycisphaerae bacterium]|nr:type II secretion system protein GspG [Phycisphaerae bacterium]